MAHTVAFAGKGGTGKTTVCGILIDYLAKRGKGPVLAVDADPNANLNEVLGVRAGKTLGELREVVAHAALSDSSPIPAGMTKQEYAAYQFGTALTEEDDFDMLVMGRTQGQGCYCYVNGVLTTQIQRYLKNYRYVVVDNEAGLEHISRGVLPAVDTMLLVSDSSRRGVQAAARIAQMVGELGLSPGVMKLLVNRAPGGVLPEGLAEEIERGGLDLAGVLPADPMVFEYDAQGRPAAGLPEDGPVKRALYAVFEKLGL